MKYSYQDMQELSEFIKNNPEKELENFFEERANYINKRELKLFDDVTYKSFRLKEYKATLYIYTDNTQALYNEIKSKLIGNKTYIDFYSEDCWLFIGALLVFDEGVKETRLKEIRKKDFTLLPGAQREEDIDIFLMNKEKFRKNHYSFWSDYDLNLFVSKSIQANKKFTDLFIKS